jgi:uncharacterized protein YndB with AHSA1/START domain
MRRHVHEESFPVAPEQMFASLHTPSAVRGWWGARTVVTIPETGGYWAAAWGEAEDDPDYVTCARLVEFDPPRRLTFGDYRYFAKSGPPPFEADFLTTFEVEPQPDGCLLRVTQAGFPDGAEADDFYAACGTGWTNTFQGIRRYLGTEDDS